MAVAELSVRLVAGGIVLPTHLPVMPIFFNLKYKLKTNKAKY